MFLPPYNKKQQQKNDGNVSRNIKKFIYFKYM